MPTGELGASFCGWVGDALLDAAGPLTSCAALFFVESKETQRRASMRLTDSKPVRCSGVTICFPLTPIVRKIECFLQF
jgi:hypothetical protein